MKARVRVLIVDDSAAMRTTMRALLSAHDDIEVVGEAGDGEAAVEQALRLRPDIVTMDVIMPGLDGISSIKLLMTRAATRVIVVSSGVSDRGSKDDAGALSMRAIAAGALELIAKPGPHGDPVHFGVKLAEAIRLMAEVPVVTHRALEGAVSASVGGRALVRGRVIDAIAIAASTGGPPVLATLVAALRGLDSPPVFIAQHLAEGYAPALARWLGEHTGVRTLLAVEGAPAERRTVYLAPDGKDVIVEAGLRLGTPPPTGHHRPSADRLLSSLARAVSPAQGARIAGIVLTGMGADGAHGLLDIKRVGGLTVVQDPATCVVGGMPAAALALAAADAASIEALTSALADMARH